jgi:N-acetylglucosamine-6-phosphate deacetylase
MSRFKIHNGSIITPFRVITNGSVIIENGVITAVHEYDAEGVFDNTLDAKGQFIAPGFIDIHLHGGGDADFMDATPEAFCKIAETHARYGTTSMMPTTLSCERDELINTLDSYKIAVKQNTKGAQFLGMHIEGPYFAMNQRGAQDPRFIRNPDPAEYRQLVKEFDIIKRWSAAPELPGAIEFAQFMRANGILPALAHTDATYEEVIKGFEAGYTLATHLYSGMSIVSRRNAFRYAGAVESAFLIDEMYVEVIADGCHLPAPLLQLIYKIKGAGKIALITDAMRAAGMPEGKSLLGSKRNGLTVLVEDGVAKLPDRSSFAGSVATTDRLVRNMVRLAGVPLPEAVQMMTQTPAAILGISNRKGSITAGKDADIVIFDQEIRVSHTIINGNVVF